MGTRLTWLEEMYDEYTSCKETKYFKCHICFMA